MVDATDFIGKRLRGPGLDPVIAATRVLFSREIARVQDSDGVWQDVTGDGAQTALALANAVSTTGGSNRSLLSIFDALSSSVIEDIQAGTYDGDLTETVRDFLLANPGRQVYFPAGVYPFASETLAQEGIELVTGSGIIGEIGLTEFDITGDDIAQVFRTPLSGVQNVLVRGIKATGNGVQGGFTSGGFFNAQYTTNDATADFDNVYVEDCDLDNFASAYHILFEHLGHSDGGGDYTIDNTRTMRNCGTRRNTYKSRDGNIWMPGTIGATSCFVEFIAYAGPIRDFICDDRTMDAEFIKQGVRVSGNAASGTIRADSILNCGFDAVGSSAGAYGVMLYQLASAGSTPGDEGQPRDITVDVGTLSAWSCGCYLAGAKRVTVRVGTLTGQGDSGDTDLPKGGITLNGARDITAEVTSAYGNRISCDIAGLGGGIIDDDSLNANINVRMNSTDATLAHFRVASNPGEGNTGGIRIRGSVRGTGKGFKTQEVEHASIGLHNLDVDFDADLTTGTVIESNLSYAYPLRNCTFGGKWKSGGTIWNTNDGSLWATFVIAPSVVSGLGTSGAGPRGFYIVNGRGLTFRPLLIKDYGTSQPALSIVGCQGIIPLDVVQFQNVTARFDIAVSPHLGAELPTWASATGAPVANLNYTAPAAGADGARIIGWENATGATDGWRNINRHYGA